MTREEKIEYLAKAVMTLSELGDNKTASVLNEIRLELKRQPFLPSDVDEAAENYIAPIENDEGLDYINFNGRDIKDAFKAGAEWMKEKDTRDMYMSDNRHYEKVYELGKKDMKKKMLEDAVEGKVVQYAGVGAQAISVDGIALNEVLKPMGLKDGDTVRLIVLKAEEDKK